MYAFAVLAYCTSLQTSSECLTDCLCVVVLELQDLPCFATRYADSARITNTSPSRGKIRPGKELIILSDDANQSGRTTEDGEPSVSDDGISCDGQGESERGASNATDQTATAAKKFSSMSMIERQAEWLRKKQEKMEAERCRQEEEKDKELTFQPKILRRSTLGEKPSKDTPSGPSRTLQRSDTTGGNTRKLDVTAGTGSTESKASVGVKEKAIPRVPPRSAGRRKKPSISVSQPIEISSNLLESMKSELNASISKSYAGQSAAPPETELAQDDLSSAVNEGGPDKTTETASSPECSEDPAQHEEHPMKSWSDQPTIGGRRIDFDSSETKARLVLQDASKFALSSMYRKTDKKARRDGVALHMGRREDNFEEEVIAVLFDKEKVSELEAARWWHEHEHRFAEFMHELPKPTDYSLT